jgi:hypothetical protein
MTGRNLIKAERPPGTARWRGRQIIIEHEPRLGPSASASEMALGNRGTKA